MTVDVFLSHTKDSLNLALEALADRQQQLDDLQEQVKGLKDFVEECMRELGRSGYNHAGFRLHWRKNTPSHRLNWQRLERELPSLYTTLIESGVATLSLPRTPESLVFGRVQP